ncbi:MAG: glycine--tRNA ligase [Methanomassiliicoccales archaeon]|nr:MAG: glycine--tRNA ligase [Methanomassiliicoccales archaeon]
MDSDKVLTLAKRRGFLWPSSEIYGGIAGFYDYGPLGSTMKRNIEDIWRRYYVLGEGFAEISSTMISPEEVFVASGHVKEFLDFLVECTKCGEVFRADHMVRDFEPNADALSAGELAAIIDRENVVCLRCKGTLSSPKPFNLMFELGIGAGLKGGRKGYLRPETAQGIFTNFGLLYRHFREKMPFGVVQIGRGFRNEISPRQGVIRLRELNMAEAELFIKSEDDSWPKYQELSGEKLTLVPNEGEMVSISLGEAVEKGIIKKQVLGYFVALTQKFLVDVGVDPEKLRFRQHLKDEMAHYAADCWDAEAKTSFGWVELVGVADRTCYDLQGHIDHSKQDLRAFERYEEATEVEKKKVIVKPEVLGPKFKKDAGKIKMALEGMNPEDLAGKDSVTVNVDGKNFEVEKDCFVLDTVKEKISGERYVPNVIEPSYGIDRIFYTVLEHAYHEEDDYVTLRLDSRIAPISVGVFPLMAKSELIDKAKPIDDKLRSKGIMTYYDESGSIGRRYARMDEVGTPFCITVDYDTLKDDGVTIRDRDTKEQARVKITEILEVLGRLLEGKVALVDLAI